MFYIQNFIGIPLSGLPDSFTKSLPPVKNIIIIRIGFDREIA